MAKRLLLLVSILAILPFVGGCFGGGGGGHNPLASTSLSQSKTASQSGEVVSPELLAARIKAQSAGKSRYSYAEPSFVIVHKPKNLPICGPGFLKMRILGADSADNIFITLDSMKVKHKTGQVKSIAITSREIDLTDVNMISDLMDEVQLPSGVYNYMEFRIKNGRIVVGGVSYPLVIPSNRIRFFGSFEIKDGYRTEVTIRFFKKIAVKIIGFGRWKQTQYLFLPVVRISSTLVPRVTAPTDGDVAGIVSDYVKKIPIQGVNVSLAGTSFSAVSDANGAFSFTKVPVGTYTINLVRSEYLNRSATMAVKGGETAELAVEMNPTVIRSSVANTGWFSECFPVSDANGEYGEMSLETPVTIDFVSLAFTKAELVFDAEYRLNGAGRMVAYFSSSQQVEVMTNMGGWWVGNNALLGYYLGTIRAENPAAHYTFNVTEYVRNNPSAAYFFAAKNEDAFDIRMLNVQLSIFYQ